MITTVEEYLENASEEGRVWLKEFFAYMAEKHPELTVAMFRQCPMYKFHGSYLKGCVKVKFKNTELIPALITLLDQAISRKANLDGPTA